MTNYFETISILCFVALAFGAARFGWIAGSYVYYAMIRLVSKAVCDLVDIITKTNGK